MNEETLTIETPPENEGLTIDLEQGELEDPGTREGKARKPKEEHEPPPDSPRFKKVYAAWKNAEEKIEELNSKFSTSEAIMDEMRQHNKNLVEKLEKIASRPAESPMPSGEPPEIRAARKSIEDLEEQKVEAIEKVDGKAVSRIDRELRKLERVVEGYEWWARNEQNRRARERAASQPKEEGLPKEIQDFVDNTPWYNQDLKMTGYANMLDAKMMNSKEWENKPVSKRLAEVRRQVEAEFNWQPDGMGRTTKPPAVESGVGLNKPGGAGGRSVKLTAQQIKVAEGLGISVEDYAKQLDYLNS